MASSTPPPLDQNAIPCDGCTQCCKNDQVILRPEDGDDLSLYDWEPIASALYPGRTSAALKRDPVTGHCVYLGETGCTIHDKRPAICRRYHCARTALALEQIPRHMRKTLKRRGDVFDKALLERGRDRLRLAREMGLEHLLDTERQVAAFEKIAAMPPPPKPRRR